jgi:hypothetical protein
VNFEKEPVDSRMKLWEEFNSTKLVLTKKIEKLQNERNIGQDKYERTAKLSLDTSYLFNRYQPENVNEEPNRSDPRDDSTSPQFWLAPTLTDKDTVRSRLCIDNITISSYPTLKSKIKPSLLVMFISVHTTVGHEKIQSHGSLSRLSESGLNLCCRSHSWGMVSLIPFNFY